MAMVYEWKEASYITIDAAAAGEFLEALKTRHNGHLSPRAVVEAARPADSPIHAHFEWDDGVAAERYRQDQAGHMLRCLIVRLPEHEAKPMRAYVNVAIAQDRSYVTTQDAMGDPELRAQVLAAAMRELVSFHSRYKELRELAEVFAAIDGLSQ